MKWVKHPKVNKDINKLSGNRTLTAIGDAAEKLIDKMLAGCSLDDVSNDSQGFERIHGGASGYTYYSARLNAGGRIIIAVNSSSSFGVIVGVTPTHDYDEILRRDLSAVPAQNQPHVPVMPVPRPYFPGVRGPKW